MTTQNLNHLFDRWSTTWRALGGSGSGFPVVQYLVNAYQEPTRHYHTIDHILQCLAMLDRFSHLATLKNEVAMAIWFHDCIYNPKGRDNEDASAIKASHYLYNYAKLPGHAVNRITRMIRDTAHTHAPQTSDSKLLSDIDLSILGSSWEDFDAYEVSIRKEYIHVPDAMFSAKRIEILNRILKTESIYHNSEIAQMFENQARSNISRSIERLSMNAQAFT